MDNPEDISITPEMLSKIDVEWLREIDSASRSPESGYVTSFQCMPSHKNAAVQLILNPSQQCNVLTVSASQEGFFGEMGEDLMDTYHNMLSNETDVTGSIEGKDFMKEKEFTIEDQFILENTIMMDNDSECNISSNSFVDDLSEFLTFPAVNDSLCQNCLIEEDMYDSAIDKMNLSKMTSFPCDPCHHLMNTTGLCEKSTLEVSATKMYGRATCGLHENSTIEIDTTGMCDQFTTEISNYGHCEKSTIQIDATKKCEHTAAECHTAEVSAKSAIGMPESFIKELEEIVHLIGKENEESAHGLPSDDLNKSAEFSPRNETLARNQRNQNDIPVESLKYEIASSLTENSLQYTYMDDSLRDNVIPLSNLTQFNDHGNFGAVSDSTSIFQGNNDTCVKQITVYDINSNSKECCKESINLETYASVTDSCRNLLTIPNDQSDIHLTSVQECSGITNTLHLTQFEKDNGSQAVTSASYTKEEQCINEPNIYFPSACISSFSLQDGTDTPQQFSNAMSSQTFCSYNAEKQSGCLSSYEQERFEKPLVECSNIETYDIGSGSSFLTNLKVSGGTVSEKETEPGINQSEKTIYPLDRQCYKTISLLDTNLITHSCVTIKNNVKYSYKRRQVDLDQRAVNEFNQCDPKKLCLPLVKADQGLKGREILTDQSNNIHESSSYQEVSMQTSPKGDKNFSAGYCILVNTVKGPKSSTLFPFNDPISCRNKPPAKHKEFAASSSADYSIVFGKIDNQRGIQEQCGVQENKCGIQEKQCRIQENNFGVLNNQHTCTHPISVKGIKANEKPDKCTCHRVNVGMKSKYVSLLVRDMWNESVKDLLHLSGHGSEPKSEKEIAKEMKAERNMLLMGKKKRLLYNN